MSLQFLFLRLQDSLFCSTCWYQMLLQRKKSSKYTQNPNNHRQFYLFLVNVVIEKYKSHCLSQHGVWVPFWTPKPLKRTPQDTQSLLCRISKNLKIKLIIKNFHLFIIPMTLIYDIMPNFDKFIHVYGWNMIILWSPLKNWTPKNFTKANFRHPVSKSWLRHW